MRKDIACVSLLLNRLGFSVLSTVFTASSARRFLPPPFIFVFCLFSQSFLSSCLFLRYVRSLLFPLVSFLSVLILSVSRMCKSPDSVDVCLVCYSNPSQQCLSPDVPFSVVSVCPLAPCLYLFCFICFQNV